jgi:metal-responsive CopG/Arc/MetJ family transcriptional regulator
MMETVERDYTTLSIPLVLAERIDKVLKVGGYMSRSDFTREAIRRFLDEIEKEAKEKEEKH